MRIDRGIRPRQECFQRLARILIEAAGQEVIEEHVGDHAGVVAMLRDEHAPERHRGAVRISEHIDRAMLHDAVADAAREAIAQRPFHEIAGEVADEGLGIVAG